MDRTDSEGKHTIRVHLQGLVARGKLPQSALDGPDWPDALGYLLDWATELGNTRQPGMHVMGGFTYVEIEAWARLTARAPSLLEMEALMLIDAAQRFPGGSDDEGHHG